MFRNIFLFLLTVMCLFSFVKIFAAESGDTETSETQTGVICDINQFSLLWPKKVVRWFSAEYALQQTGSLQERYEVDFELLREGQSVEKKSGEKYVRIFNQAGEVTLKTNIRSSQCSHTLENVIRVYDAQYLSLGFTNLNIEENFSEFFEKNNILYLSLPHKEEKYDISTIQGASNLIQEYQWTLKQTQKIFIDESVSINVLDAFVKSLKSSKDLDFSQKDIFVITSKNNSFLSKVLAPYIKQLGITKIGFIRQDSFLDALSDIIGNLPANIKYTSFEKQQSFFSLNMFIRYLTYSGLELSFIGLFLSISLAILVVNFAKQVVGLNVFGVYYPVLLALCLVLLKFSFVIVFFILWFISLSILTLLSKKTYLLYVPKRTILLTLFLILTLVFLGIDNYFSLGIIDINTFSNTFILFPFLILLLISDKVLHEEVQILSKKWVFYIGELFLITWLCYIILSNTTIQYFLLTFPDLLFVFLFLNILISKYTGLQILEYARFTPLLKKLSEEE